MVIRKDNVELICSVAELTGLFEKSESLEDFLQAVVSTVAYHMNAAVCSIYLYDEEQQSIVLRANQGLNPEAIGTLQLKLGEGITGTALKELRPIRYGRGSKHPDFKFFPGTEEEKYEAFLAVPILRGLTRIGVLVVQDSQPDYFDENDTRALQAIAAQLATTVENAYLLMSLYQRGPWKPAEAVDASVEPNLLLRGSPVSEGFAFGSLTVLGDQGEHFIVPRAADGEGKTEDDFNRALQESERQVNQLQRDMEENASDISSLIFNAHLLILRDSQFSGSMLERIRQGEEVSSAIAAVVNEYIRLFSNSQNSKLREKAYDVKDVGHRLLHNLSSRQENEAEYQGEIIVAPEMLPSDILKLSTQGAEGLILLGGSSTSHVSILARSLNLPTVILNDRRLLAATEGTPIQMDAYQGIVYVNPTEEVVENFVRLREAREKADQLETKVQPQSYTVDGTRILLLANVNLLSDLQIAERLKAEGVGLYRSEFPFIVRNDFPSEEEQYRIYRTLVERMAGKPVTLRTLDIGGDKMLSYFPSVSETNPFLGLRAIRFSLKNKHIFTQQLCAMLRAGHGSDFGILFPLVSSVDDFLQAKEVVQGCLDRLARDGIVHNTEPKLGVMIELPSAVEVANELAQEADLLSIGTNDLVQYTLAVDRTNMQISHLYSFHHPAVLRSLKRVADAAKTHGKALSICGDLIGDLKLLPFLVGIGIRTFSINSKLIPAVQKSLAAIDVVRAEKTAEAMLRMGRVSEVNAFLQHPEV